MSSSTADTGTLLATDVQFDAERLHVALSDGRQISVPLGWFPRLRGATMQQRQHWELIGRGVGIHWPDLDEDLSVAGLLAGNRPRSCRGGGQ
jgi:hypothetical protein